MWVWTGPPLQVQVDRPQYHIRLRHKGTTWGHDGSALIVGDATVCVDFRSSGTACFGSKRGRRGRGTCFCGRVIVIWDQMIRVRRCRERP